MRICGIILSLILIMVVSPLYAQTSGTGSAGTGGSGTGVFSENSSFQSVENVSAQVSSSSGFVGGGRPGVFAGIDEVNAGTVASARSSASSSRSTASTRRSTSRSTASRRTVSQAGGARSSRSRNNSQYVRATASVDFDVPRMQFLEQRMAGTITSNLQRMQGIQDSQVTFKSSPTGTTAVLTGTVTSERERRVARQLLLLEPGISQVENLLEIQ